MIALIQRVAQAQVVVAGRTVGQIGRGLLVLVCAEPQDTEAQAERLVTRLLKLRIFSDEAGKMNRDLRDMRSVVDAHTPPQPGGLLIVSQFTLAADLSGGNRPSFTGAAPAALGRVLYDRVVALARERHPIVATGVFGADMQVHLVNDGPVTMSMKV